MDQIRHDSVKPCWHPIDFTDRRWAYSSYYLVLHRSQPQRIEKRKRMKKDHQNISKTILSFTPVGCIMIVFIHPGRQSEKRFPKSFTISGEGNEGAGLAQREGKSNGKGGVVLVQKDVRWSPTRSSVVIWSDWLALIWIWYNLGACFYGIQSSVYKSKQLVWKFTRFSHRSTSGWPLPEASQRLSQALEAHQEAKAAVVEEWETWSWISRDPW